MFKIIKKIDYLILIIIALIFSIGAVALYSASHGAGGIESEFDKQITWFIVGTIALIFFTFFDYKHLKKLWIPFYIVINILLIVVLFSNKNNGATSWIKFGTMSLQPSEFAKIVAVSMMAFFINYFSEKGTLNHISRLIIMLIFLSVPIGLIVIEPDYGTALVLVISSAMMLYIGGIKARYIIIATVLTAISLPLAYNYILPEHAKSRIMVYLNPESDPRGAGYNILQSKLAVGSGGITGMGVFEGTQTQLGLLPMKSTDFIFSVISEEMGFVASASIVILYTVLLFRILNIARKSKDRFGSVICIGVFGVFFVHIVENIGMSMGLLPITGIPLPFISYGGSSMLTNMILVGICESVKTHQKKHLL